MGHFYHEAMRFVQHMSLKEWLVALFAVVLVGLVCMRGFGSRSNY
jgi:hypothetical protein